MANPPSATCEPSGMLWTTSVMVLTLSDMEEALIFYIRHRDQWTRIPGRQMRCRAGTCVTGRVQFFASCNGQTRGANSRQLQSCAASDKMPHTKTDARKDMEWDRSEKRTTLARRRHLSAYA